MKRATSISGLCIRLRSAVKQQARNIKNKYVKELDREVGGSHNLRIG